MKNIFRISGIICILLSILCFNSCKKQPNLPVVTTNLFDVRSTMIIAGGEIISEGGAEVTLRGVCWDTTANPTTSNYKTFNGKGIGSFVSNLTGLDPGCYYYMRAYATNRIGTAYGNQINISTVIPLADIIFNSELTYYSVSDIEGNIYKTIQIGTQTWMAENLKTTKYNDGTNLPFITSGEWTTMTTPGYCWYTEEWYAKDKLGGLYNFYAVVNSHKICPTGWHVPTGAEWTTLIDYVGGADVAGPKLREIGNAYWFENNTEATNESGFTALPGGARDAFQDEIWGLGRYGQWWSATTYPAWGTALCFSIHCEWGGSSVSLGPAVSINDGYSVRCIKDSI